MLCGLQCGKTWRQMKVGTLFSILLGLWILVCTCVYNHIEPEVNFGEALFWMSTIVTTVGYGMDPGVPKTDWGMLFFIIICIPTILFGILYLSALGELITMLFDCFTSCLHGLWACANKKYAQRRDELATEINYTAARDILEKIEKLKDQFRDEFKLVREDLTGDNRKILKEIDEIYKKKDHGAEVKKILEAGNKSPSACRVFSNVVKFVIYFGLFIILPAVYYTYMDASKFGFGGEWSWWKALYFHMVSSTTVGFGDFALEINGKSDAYVHIVNTIIHFTCIAVVLAHINTVKGWFDWIVEKTFSKCCPLPCCPEICQSAEEPDVQMASIRPEKGQEQEQNGDEEVLPTPVPIEQFIKNEPRPEELEKVDMQAFFEKVQKPKAEKPTAEEPTAEEPTAEESTAKESTAQV